MLLFGAALVHAYTRSPPSRSANAASLARYKRPQPWNANSDQPHTKKGRKGAKGDGKGKDGKGAKKLKQGSDRTPEGKPICFRFNAEGCKDGASAISRMCACYALASTPLASAHRRRPRRMAPPTLRTDRPGRRTVLRYSSHRHLQPPLQHRLPHSNRYVYFTCFLVHPAS